MPVSLPDFAAYVRLEHQHLLKADTDIDQGRKRLAEQEERLARLNAAGYDCRQAGELVELLRQTLGEWERHRVLIRQRLDYLQRRMAGHDS